MDPFHHAAETIASAEALLICAGAGMGVDSGLPDFRGPEGFWRAYPPYRDRGLHFEELAQPGWFESDPALAWGFYGHRLELYRATKPHEGFSILRRWAEAKPLGAFVFTSNVDGHFEKAGFGEEQILECHGSLFHAQCLRGCGVGIFPASEFHIDVDPETCLAKGELPSCPSCGGLARPNVLMFGDWGWDDARTARAQARFEAWLGRVEGKKLAIVEMGAGTRIPSVRRLSEQVAGLPEATLIRINIREAHGPGGTLSLPMKALEALERLDELVG